MGKINHNISRLYGKRTRRGKTRKKSKSRRNTRKIRRKTARGGVARRANKRITHKKKRYTRKNIKSYIGGMNQEPSGVDAVLVNADGFPHVYGYLRQRDQDTGNINVRLPSTGEADALEPSVELTKYSEQLWKTGGLDGLITIYYYTGTDGPGAVPRRRGPVWVGARHLTHINEEVAIPSAAELLTADSQTAIQSGLHMAPPAAGTPINATSHYNPPNSMDRKKLLNTDGHPTVFVYANLRDQQMNIPPAVILNNNSTVGTNGPDNGGLTPILYRLGDEWPRTRSGWVGTLHLRSLS
jgi:hypothetical protein